MILGIDSDLITPTRHSRPLISYIIVAVLVALALAILVVAAIPYPALKTQLQALTLHGHADLFTEGMHRGIVILLRAAAGVSLLVACGVFLFRHRVAQTVSYMASSVYSSLVEMIVYAANVLRTESRLHRSLLAGILLLALGIRLLFLFQPMRYDEAYTFTHFASTPIYLAVSNFSSTNNHLFNTILVKVSYSIFGNHPWALRIPALIAGWLLVPASYFVTRIYFDRVAALLASALVASSAPLILFSTNARGYSLMSLFFLLLLGLAPSCLRSTRPGPWILFSIVTALGFYTLPTMLYGFAIAAGWLLLMSLRETGPERLAALRRLVFASVLGAGLTVLLYSPVLLVWGTNMRNTDVLPQSWDRFVAGVPASALSAWRQWNTPLPGLVEVLLAAGFIAAVVGHSRVSHFRVPLAAAILWVAPVVAIQRVVPYDRVWIFLLPLYFVIASVGLALLWRVLIPSAVWHRTEALGLVGFALAGVLTWNVAATQSVYYADDTGTLRDGETIAVWMKDHLRSSDIVLTVTPADGPLEYYFPKLGLRPVDYWYSTQLKGSPVQPGRRVLAVVRDRGPDLSSMMKTAGLPPSGFSTPEAVQRFNEASIYQLVAIGPED